MRLMKDDTSAMKTARVSALKERSMESGKDSANEAASPEIAERRSISDARNGMRIRTKAAQFLVFSEM